jgi:hypothetical protein
MHNPFETDWWFLAEDTSLAIAALWVMLALGRRLRAAPDWTERLGRVVGAAWIAFAVLGILLKYVPAPR